MGKTDYGALREELNSLNRWIEHNPDDPYVDIAAREANLLNAELKEHKKVLFQEWLGTCNPPPPIPIENRRFRGLRSASCASCA